MESQGILGTLAKVDFADALGVAVGPDTVAIAHLSKRLTTVKVLATASYPLETGPELRLSEAAGLVQKFAADAGLEGARVALVLDADATLTNEMLLPAAADESCAGWCAVPRRTGG